MQPLGPAQEPETVPNPGSQPQLELEPEPEPEPEPPLVAGLAESQSLRELLAEDAANRLHGGDPTWSELVRRRTTPTHPHLESQGDLWRDCVLFLEPGRDAAGVCGLRRPDVGDPAGVRLRAIETGEPIAEGEPDAAGDTECPDQRRGAARRGGRRAGAAGEAEGSDGALRPHGSKGARGGRGCERRDEAEGQGARRR